MPNFKSHSAGGKARAKIQKEEARLRILKYAESPNHCLFCDNPILPKEGQTLTQVLVKKFCDRRCSARHHNANRATQIKIPSCTVCAVALGPNSKAKFCDPCRPAARGLRIVPEDMSLADVKTRYANYPSQRSLITKHARRTFTDSNKSKLCFCGYPHKADVAHIKSVKSFADSAMLSEINHVDNLVALCPNHHWEYDNDLLDL